MSTDLELLQAFGLKDAVELLKSLLEVIDSAEEEGWDSELLQAALEAGVAIKELARSTGMEELCGLFRSFEQFFSLLVSGTLELSLRQSHTVQRVLEEVLRRLQDEQRRSAQELDLKDLQAAIGAMLDPNQDDAAESIGHSEYDLFLEDVKEGHKSLIGRESYARIAVNKIDDLLEGVGELVVARSMLQRALAEHQAALPPSLFDNLNSIGKLIQGVQESSNDLKLVPVKPMLGRLQKLVRSTAERFRKILELEVIGADLEVENSILDYIFAPLAHILVNAIEHGIETRKERKAAGKAEQAKIVLKLVIEDDRVVITVSDDGRGLSVVRVRQTAIDRGLIHADAILSEAEVLALIYEPGFSTNQKKQAPGLGLDYVYRIIQEVRGSIDLDTELGKGTSFKIQLPYSLSVISGMMIRLADTRFMIPLSQLAETIELKKHRVYQTSAEDWAVELREQAIRMMDLGVMMGMRQGDNMSNGFGLLTTYRGQRVCFVCDQVIGRLQIVLKKQLSELEGLPGIFGLTILDDGEPGVVIDLHQLVGGRLEYERAA